MQCGHISGSIHLGVQRSKQPAGTVIVDDQIMQTEDLRRCQHQPADSRHQFGVRGAPQQGINGVLHGIVPGIQNEYRNQHTQPAVRLDIEKMTGKRSQQYHAGGNHIAEAVGGGCLHGGGMKFFAQLAVKEIHPALD